MKLCAILLISCHRGYSYIDETEEKHSGIHGEKAEQGVKESCDEEKKRNFLPEPLLLTFSM